MTTEQIAWAAGLFEGEGCFSLCKRKDRPRSAPQAVALLRMTDEDVVRKFHSLISMGTVCGFGPAKPGYKPFWQWQAKGYRHLYLLVHALWPYLGMRRRARAKEVLMNCAQPSEEFSKTIQEVWFERHRQDDRFGVQDHTPEGWLIILTKKMGDLSQAILKYRTTKGSAVELAEHQMKKELIQVAAVATAMVECLNRKRWKQP